MPSGPQTCTGLARPSEAHGNLGQFGEADDVIGMEMCQKHLCHVGRVDRQPGHAGGHASTAIEQQFLGSASTSVLIPSRCALTVGPADVQAGRPSGWCR